MKKLKRDRIIDNLIERGSKEVKCRSGKYRQFTRTDSKVLFYFLGKNGAVRIGKSASNSRSVTSSFSKI